MKRIIYEPNSGEAIPDALCLTRARRFLEVPGDGTIEVSTENFIHACRVLIHEGEIPHTEVKFVFRGSELYPDKDGRIDFWPRGFCDHAEMFMCRLLDWGKKQARENEAEKG